ncbi:hypothetical protein D3C86_2146480 [compost metagenome]
MTSKENLLRLIDRLPEDRLAELEKLVISMLAADATIAPPREPGMSFEEAHAYVTQTFEKTFRRLAES